MKKTYSFACSLTHQSQSHRIKINYNHKKYEENSGPIPSPDLFSKHCSSADVHSRISVSPFNTTNEHMYTSIYTEMQMHLRKLHYKFCHNLRFRIQSKLNNSLTQQTAELIDFINTMALSHQLSLISWGFPQFHAFICFAGLSPASFCALRFALESVSLLTSQVQAVRWTKIFFHVMLFTRKSSANM